MRQEVILVLDHGTTNVQAIAVGRQGKIAARAVTLNASDIAAENSIWYQWSLEVIPRRFAGCCQRLSSQLAAYQTRGIAVTTFDVDGALVDKNDKQLYPVIDWKCLRIAAIMENIHRYMSPRQLQEVSGVGAFNFSTLHRLVQLKENHPQLLEWAHA